MDATAAPGRAVFLERVTIRAGTAGGGVQFLVATHSPVLLTYPGARIVSFDGGVLADVALEDTAHYQITKRILDAPQRYWRHLLADVEGEGAGEAR